MKKLRQQGFTHLEVILIVVVLLVIVAVGVYVFKRSKDNQQASNQTATTSQTAQSDGTRTSSSQSSTQKYLEISELGVKFPLTDSLKGLYYVPSETSDNVVYFSLDSLKGTPCAADKIPVMALSKNSDQNLANDPAGELIKQKSKRLLTTSITSPQVAKLAVPMIILGWNRRLWSLRQILTRSCPVLCRLSRL